MTNLTWDQLAQLPVTYACNLDVQTIAQCRAMIEQVQRIERLEQWIIAGFWGVGLIITALAWRLVGEAALWQKLVRGPRPDFLGALRTALGRIVRGTVLPARTATQELAKA